MKSDVYNEQYDIGDGAESGMKSCAQSCMAGSVRARIHVQVSALRGHPVHSRGAEEEAM